MLSCQFQNLVVTWIVVVAEPRCFEAVIVSGSLLQLLGHLHPSDEHRTITASNAMLYTSRTRLLLGAAVLAGVWLGPRL